MEITQINKTEFVALLAEYRKSKVQVVDGEEKAVYASKIVTKKATSDFTEDFLDLLVQLAGKGIGVKFPAVFETEVIPTPERTARNPQDGSEVTVPAGHKIKTTPKKHLKDAVKAINA